MTTLQTARTQYWLTVAYPSICEMLARLPLGGEADAIEAPRTGTAHRANVAPIPPATSPEVNA